MVVVAVIVVAAGAAAVVAWYRTRPESAGKRAPARPRVGSGPAGTETLPWYRTRLGRAKDVVPAFRILALGPSGAGKSVYLAGMYNELKSARRRGYHLRLPDLGKKQTLNSIYAQVSDPEGEWPAGTGLGEFTEFDFECVGPGGKHVFTLSLLDYSGELLESATAEYEDDRTRLMAEARDAHAIFGIIDGRQVVRSIDEEADAIRYLRHTIETMLDVLSEARCPVHLIVTKWDLVRAMDGRPSDDDDVLLAIVRRALLDEAGIARLAEDRGLGERVIRLIPVSAVGDGFAAIAEDGTVKKRGKSKPEPVNIEVPIAAVVPDLFQQLRGHLRRRKPRSKRLAGAGQRMFMRLGQVSIGAGAIALGVLGYPAHYGASAALDLFTGWMREKPPAADGEAVGSTRVDPAQQVLEWFAESVRRLEASVPSSLIRAGSSDA